jgi:hypothetical protein
MHWHTSFHLWMNKLFVHHTSVLVCIHFTSISYLFDIIFPSIWFENAPANMTIWWKALDAWFYNYCFKMLVFRYIAPGKKKIPKTTKPGTFWIRIKSSCGKGIEGVKRGLIKIIKNLLFKYHFRGVPKRSGQHIWQNREKLTQVWIWVPFSGWSCQMCCEVPFGTPCIILNQIYLLAHIIRQRL